MDVRWNEAKRIRSEDVDRVILQKNDRDLLIEITSGMQYHTTGPDPVNEFLKQHLNPDQVTSRSK